MWLQSLRSRIVSWAIRDSVPVLNLVRRPEPWPTLDELERYPDASLGREVARFLGDRRVPFLPHYENQDAIHLILEYDTTARGELQLQAFLWGNGESSFAARVLCVWGGLMLPEHIGAMRRARARGTASARLDEKRLSQRLREPMSAVRAGLRAVR